MRVARRITRAGLANNSRTHRPFHWRRTHGNGVNIDDFERAIRGASFPAFVFRLSLNLSRRKFGVSIGNQVYVSDKDSNHRAANQTEDHPDPKEMTQRAKGGFGFLPKTMRKTDRPGFVFVSQ